jgi:hypothetical protein
MVRIVSRARPLGMTTLRRVAAERAFRALVAGGARVELAPVEGTIAGPLCVCGHFCPARAARLDASAYGRVVPGRLGTRWA